MANLKSSAIKLFALYVVSALLVLTTAGFRPVEAALISYTYHQEADAQIYASFSTANTSINFTHISVDPSSGRIYAGAVNWLYQFSPDLTFEQHVRTGPKEDSASCSPSDCSGVDPSMIRMTNNYNKALVVDTDSRMLIVCGSVHQGSCRRHRLDDIRAMEPLVTMPVASNDENSSTVAFIGPARYFGNVPSKVLYVAATNSRQGPYRDLVPAISSRYLESSGSHLFNIIEKSFTDTARVDISFHLRDYYLVKYITGFASNDFVYFATVQRKSHLRALEEWGYVTRLARVCNSDAGFHSYTEITISCQAGGIDYNLLQDAWVMPARSEQGSDVLIGVFAAGKDHTNVATGAAQSAMCMFPLLDIEEKFAENIHLCYNGSVTSRNMDYIAGGVNECPEQGKAGNVVNFCHEAVKLNGSVPLVAHPLLVYQNLTLTAVAATRAGKQAIALLGTSRGSLKKVLITSPHRAEEVEEVMVDAGHPILGDLLLDASHEFAYVASPYKIAKIKVQRCLDRSNCSLPAPVAGSQEPMVHRAHHTTSSPRPSSPSTPRPSRQDQYPAIPTLPARPLDADPRATLVKTPPAPSGHEHALHFDHGSRHREPSQVARPAEGPYVPPMTLLRDHCPPAFAGGLYWNWTRVDESITIPCPSGATGHARLFCSMVDDTPQWTPVKRPLFSDCYSNRVSSIIDRINKGDSAIHLAAELDEITRPVGNADSRTLFGGDLIRISDIVNQLVVRLESAFDNFLDRQHKAQLAKDLVESVQNTASNMLEDRNEDAWFELSPTERKSAASTLMLGLERNVLLHSKIATTEFIRAFNNIYIISIHARDNSRGSVREGIALPVMIADPNAFSSNLDQVNSVNLSPQTMSDLSKGGPSKVIMIMYKKLDKLLTPEEDDVEPRGPGVIRTVLNSDIVTILVGRDRLASAANLVINFKHNQPASENLTNPTCVHWSHTSRQWDTSGCVLKSHDQAHTICECNHFTTFGLLMDVVDPTVNVPNRFGTSTKYNQEDSYDYAIAAGCVLSVLCFLILLTAAIIQIRRNKEITKQSVRSELAVELFKFASKSLTGSKDNLTGGEVAINIHSNLIDQHKYKLQSEQEPMIPAPIANQLSLLQPVPVSTQSITEPSSNSSYYCRYSPQSNSTSSSTNVTNNQLYGPATHSLVHLTGTTGRGGAGQRNIAQELKNGGLSLAQLSQLPMNLEHVYECIDDVSPGVAQTRLPAIIRDNTHSIIMSSPQKQQQLTQLLQSQQTLRKQQLVLLNKADKDKINWKAV